MKRKTISQVKKKDEARSIAINWQIWQSKKSLSYSELSEWQNYFISLAEKFNLKREFKENAII